jgi:hypothetical protein
LTKLVFLRKFWPKRIHEIDPSTLSNEDKSNAANYSAAAPVLSHPAPAKLALPLIRPKERRGQLLQALTLPVPVKNALVVIFRISALAEKSSDIFLP